MKSETVFLAISPIAVDDLKFMFNINPVSASVALIVATLALNGLIQIEYIWKQRLKKNGKILSQWKWSVSTFNFNKCSIRSEYHEVLFSVALWKLSIFNGITQWAHLRQFAINWTSKFHVESSWKLHPFWNANHVENMTSIRSVYFDVDSTFHIEEISMNAPRGFFFIVLTSSRRNFYTCRFHSIYFVTFSVLGTYSKLFWYYGELLKFQRYWRNHWFWNHWNYIF